MNGEEALSLYEAVAIVTEQMLASARAGDWERLTTLESCCAGHVEILKNSESAKALSGPARENEIKIIRRILADEREIRAVTELRMTHLSAMLASVGAERRLSQAYGASAEEDRESAIQGNQAQELARRPRA
jgi:flagellar protein FliT